jgi:hypothetical protein
MPQCQFSVFCYFCVLEKLHMKYSRNWTKQKLKFLITWHEDGVQRRAGGRPRGSHTWWWRGPPLGRATRGCDRLVHLLTSPFRLFIPSIENILRAQTLFQKTYCKLFPAPCRRRCEIGRVQKLFPASGRRGNHHRRPSSSPCLPSEWCVSSLPWTTGP